MAWEVKFKRADTGKYWGAGRLSIGKFGPQIGMKKTAELMDYINSVNEGGYINLSLWEPYDANKAKVNQESSAPESYDTRLDDEIPF